MYLSEDVVTTHAAIKWLRLANDFESPDAAWNLAMIARERGQPDEIRTWIDRAAELGQEDAAAVQKACYDVDAVLATWGQDS